MAPFAGDRVGASERPAVDHDAAADARAEDCAEHHPRAGGRAVDRLRQREAVGVVGDLHRALRGLLEAAPERTTFDPGQIDHPDQAAVGGDHARHGDPDRHRRAMRPDEHADQLDESCEGSGIVVRYRPAVACELAALRVDRDGSNLAAADIETNSDHALSRR